MHDSSGRHRRYLLLATTIVALLSCAAVGLALQRAPSQEQSLATARALWGRRSFSHYRMVTEHTGGLETCRQDVEVRDERVVAVLSNTCPRSPMTVVNLFLEIERYILTIGGQCGPNGCACDGPIGVDVVYDSRLVRFQRRCWVLGVR